MHLATRTHRHTRHTDTQGTQTNASFNVVPCLYTTQTHRHTKRTPHTSHLVLPSSPLLPRGDIKLLFTILPLPCLETYTIHPSCSDSPSRPPRHTPPLTLAPPPSKTLYHSCAPHTHTHSTRALTPSSIQSASSLPSFHLLLLPHSPPPPPQAQSPALTHRSALARKESSERDGPKCHPLAASSIHSLCFPMSVSDVPSSACQLAGVYVSTAYRVAGLCQCRGLGMSVPETASSVPDIA